MLRSLVYVLRPWCSRCFVFLYACLFLLAFRLGLVLVACSHSFLPHQCSPSLALYLVVLLRVLMSKEVSLSEALRKEYRRLQESTDRRLKASTPKDSLVVYAEQVEKSFNSSVQWGVESVLGRCRTVNEYVIGQPDLMKEHSALAEATEKIGSEVWTLWRNVKRFGKRIALLSVKVQRRMQETREKKTKKGKSIKRQEAGKKKAGPLRSWNRDVDEARLALKRAGYKGKLTLKKGGELYAKVQEIRQDRFDPVCMGSPTPVSCE